GYGLNRQDGVVDLSARFGERWPALRGAIEEDQLPMLIEAGASLAADFAASEMTYDLPIPDGEKIICVGVNYPDRNAEYKDGQESPPNPSLFPRFARSFVGHLAPLTRPQASNQLDYEGEIVLVICRSGRHIREADALEHVAGLSLCN